MCSNVEEGGIALMMEYMDGGSLQDIADNGGCTDEAVLANIASQALEGLVFLHTNRHIHRLVVVDHVLMLCVCCTPVLTVIVRGNRDIKPANILINCSGSVKISDFGILRQVDPEVDREHQVATFVGTTAYMAPERIDGGTYSYPSDIWAFGLSMLTVSIGKLPINVAGGFWTILESVRDGPAPSLPEGQGWSPVYRDFISKCMARDPADRSTAQQLLKHPFLTTTPQRDDPLVGTGDSSIQELEAILMALYKHVHQIRKEGKDSRGRKSTAGSALVVSDDGVLLSSEEMMRLVLFGDIPPSCAPGQSAGMSEAVGIAVPTFLAEVNSGEFTPDVHRMHQLAKQLNLDLDVVIRVAEARLQAIFSG
jgi:serine/threonine protein kinase